MTAEGCTAKAHGTFDRSGEETSHNNPGPDPSEGGGDTGSAGIDILFPCFGVAAFGAL